MAARILLVPNGELNIAAKYNCLYWLQIIYQCILTTAGFYFEPVQLRQEYIYLIVPTSLIPTTFRSIAVHSLL